MDQDDFKAAINASPTCALTLLAYADWCAESGEPELCRGLRWMGENGRAPVVETSGLGTGWQWFRDGKDWPEHSKLPLEAELEDYDDEADEWAREWFTVFDDPFTAFVSAAREFSLPTYDHLFVPVPT